MGSGGLLTREFVSQEVPENSTDIDSNLSLVLHSKVENCTITIPFPVESKPLGR